MFGIPSEMFGSHRRIQGSPGPGSSLGFRNRVPQIGNCKILGIPLFEGDYAMPWELYEYEVYSIICLKLTILEFPHKTFWVS